MLKKLFAMNKNVKNKKYIPIYSVFSPKEIIKKI